MTTKRHFYAMLLVAFLVISCSSDNSDISETYPPDFGEATPGEGSDVEPGPEPEPGDELDVASIECPTPQAVECLVRLYPQCGFKGAEICLTEEQYYEHGELATLGLAKGAARSVRVADGYYAKFNLTGSRDDDWEMVMRGDDSCLYLGKEPGRFAFKNVDIERRTVCRDRPRVFMAMHGSNRLAPSTHDDEWTYVRQNLDGIWENNTGVSFDEMAAIYRKIATRTMILE